MNVIARLEIELANYDSAVDHFNHYSKRTPSLNFLVDLKSPVLWMVSIFLFISSSLSLKGFEGHSNGTIYNLSLFKRDIIWRVSIFSLMFSSSQSLFQTPIDMSKGASSNWYHRYVHKLFLFLFFVLFYLFFRLFLLFLFPMSWLFPFSSNFLSSKFFSLSLSMYPTHFHFHFHFVFRSIHFSLSLSLALARSLSLARSFSFPLL